MLFARHEDSFYLKRAGQLADATVVELFGARSLNAFLPIARKLSALVEKVAVVSSVFGLQRRRTHQLIALSAHRRFGFDFAIAPALKHLHSSQREEAQPRGISINAIFVRRFDRCGFPALVTAIMAGGELAKRLEQGVTWLFESRQEISPHAAVVKTAIALGSLLIASDTEALRGSLSERAAFILADEPGRRHRIAKEREGFLRSAERDRTRRTTPRCNV